MHLVVMNATLTSKSSQGWRTSMRVGGIVRKLYSEGEVLIMVCWVRVTMPSRYGPCIIMDYLLNSPDRSGL